MNIKTEKNSTRMDDEWNLEFKIEWGMNQFLVLPKM